MYKIKIDSVNFGGGCKITFNFLSYQGYQSMKYSKSPLAIAILLALSSHVFADTGAVCPDGACAQPITTQTEINAISFNEDKTVLTFANGDGFVFTKQENASLTNAKGDVSLHAKESVIKLSSDGTESEHANLFVIQGENLQSLTLSSEKGPTVEVSTNDAQLKLGGSSGNYVNELTISAKDGVAVKGEAKKAGTYSGKFNTGDIYLYALNTTIKSEKGNAIEAGGVDYGTFAESVYSNENTDDSLDVYSEIVIEEVGDKNHERKILIQSPEKSLVATNGGGLIVEGEGGEITFKGSVDVSKNGFLELGYGDYRTFEDFPDDWKDWDDEGAGDDEPFKVRYLDKIAIHGTTDSALKMSNGALVYMGAKDILIDKGSANSAITISSTTASPKQHSMVVDIFASDSLVINGDINLDLTEGLGKGYIRIDSNGSVVVNGNINTKNVQGSQGKVDISLRGANSKLIGSVNDEVVESPKMRAFALMSDEAVERKGTYLSIVDGASWQVTGASSVKDIDADGAVIDAGSQKVEIENLNTGNNGTQFKSNSLTKNQIAVANNTGNGQVAVDVDLTQTQGVPSGEELAEALGGVISFKNNQNDTDTKVTGRNNVNDVTVTIDKDGNQKSETSLSGVVESANDITSTQMLAWRAQINDVNKRLGDLRTYEGNVGSWARVFGGKSEFGDRNLDNKYTTVQLGADAKVLDNFYVGMTAHYTDGESTLNNGSSEDQSYGFGVYGGWLADNGQFVDVIVKRTRMDTDFDLYYTNGQKSSGSFDTWGTSVSVEYGWRLNCPSTKFWVEPQVEVSYGHFEGVNYTTSTGNRTQQDSMDSLIGRFGVAVGGTFDMGSAYLKASVAHEFDGESSAAVTNGSEVGHATEDLSGTFGEVALGGTMNFTKNFSGYGEFQTTFGSPVKSPYQWNVGVRYTF